jgi:hypothetical protein
MNNGDTMKAPREAGSIKVKTLHNRMCLQGKDQQNDVPSFVAKPLGGIIRLHYRMTIRYGDANYGFHSIQLKNE